MLLFIQLPWLMPVLPLNKLLGCIIPEMPLLLFLCIISMVFASRYVCMVFHEFADVIGIYIFFLGRKSPK